MFIALCTLFGLSCGLVVSALLKRSARVVVFNSLFGVAGGLLGGFLFRLLDEGPVTAISTSSLVAPIAGALFLLATYHTVAPHRELRFRP